MATPAHTIQDALRRVAQLRQLHASDPALAQGIAEVNRFQARRFQATYADLLHNPCYAKAVRFFYRNCTATGTIPAVTSSLPALPAPSPGCSRSLSLPPQRRSPEFTR